MAIPANPDLPQFRANMKRLKPHLAKFYGVVVAARFSTLDMKRLHQAVAGRAVYPEGYNALCMVYAPDLLLAPPAPIEDLELA
jgi:hypothetical protein